MFSVFQAADHLGYGKSSKAAHFLNARTWGRVARSVACGGFLSPKSCPRNVRSGDLANRRLWALIGPRRSGGRSVAALPHRVPFRTSTAERLCYTIARRSVHCRLPTKDQGRGCAAAERRRPSPSAFFRCDCGSDPSAIFGK
jgi:hypothetical protein